MNIITIIFTVILIGIVNVVQATPKDNIWYIGNNINWSQYHDYKFYKNNFNKNINNKSTHTNEVSPSIFLGYQVNHYLGFELGYNWLGRIIYNYSIDKNIFKTSGISVSAKLSYPIFNDIKIYTRLGSMLWHANFIENKKNFKSINDTGVSPLSSIGLEYNWTKNWNTHLEYQWINNISNSNTIGIRPDNAILNIGLSYLFNHKKFNLPNSTIDKKLKPITTKYKVMFDFDKKLLTLEGKQILDQLYNYINNINLQYSHIIIIGYTDNIGSYTYNNKLSQARAQSVVNYLISRGIPAENISAYSMGKSKLITTTICSKLTGNIAIINCLAPNRRVEIEVKGIKKY